MRPRSTWCPDLVPSTVNGFLVVDNVEENSKAVDQAPNYPAAEDPQPRRRSTTKQFACIVSQTPTLAADGTLTVEEQVYVYGDIKLLR